MNLLWQIAAADPASLSSLAAKHGLSADQVEALRRLMECASAAAQDPHHRLWPELRAALGRMGPPVTASRASAPPSAQPPVRPFGSEPMNSTAPGRASTGAAALPFAGSAAAPPRISLEPVAAFGETAPVKPRLSETLPFKRAQPAVTPAPPATAPPANGGDEQASRLAAQFADAFQRRQK